MYDTLRNQVDALDEAIANLVIERNHVSQRLQHARLDAGGARTDLKRESVVRNHYQSVIGHDGAQLADAILAICRGPQGRN